MQLEHRFSVPAPLERVWAAVIDPERVAPCLPGATLTEVGENGFSGSVKVKLGPISLLYKGSGKFLETDESARRVVIKASGKDSRGNGTAAATVTLTLAGDGDGTTGTVVTDLTVTGKPAQFGRGMIAEVGGKILDTFAACLGTTRTDPTPPAQPATESAAPADRPAGKPAEDGEPQVAPKPATRRRTGTKTTVAATTTTPAGPSDNGSEPESAPRLQLVDASPVPHESEPIDLLDYAGPSVAKRLIPVLVGLVVIIFVVRRLRRR